MGGSTAPPCRPSSTATTNTCSRPPSSSSRRPARARSPSSRWRPRARPRPSARRSRWARRAACSSPTRRSRVRARSRRPPSSPRRSRRSNSTSSSPASTLRWGQAGVVPAAVAALERPAVPLLRREDRARPRRPHDPRPAHQPDRLRRARGGDAGAHQRHPGARRAAVPVAQGDHGGAVEGDRDAVPGRPRPRRRDGRRGGRDDEARRTRVRQRLVPRRASSARRADEAARQIVDFLVERRLV